MVTETLKGTAMSHNNSTENVAYTSTTGKEYTDAELYNSSRGERLGLAASAIRDGLEATSDTNVVWFMRELEIEKDIFIGDGYDLCDVEELSYLIDFKNNATRFIEDVVQATTNGDITGSEFFHYDQDGNLYFEDECDACRRAMRDRDELVENLLDLVDVDEMTLDISYVDMPDELEARFDELSEAFRCARAAHEDGAEQCAEED